jgi:hypothetical protein
MEALVAALAQPYVNDPRMAAALLLAADEVHPEHCYRDRVVVLTAAHMLAMGDRAGVGGAVASQREGGLEVTYFQAASSGGLADTAYGLEVKRLNFLCFGLTARTAWQEAVPSSVI